MLSKDRKDGGKKMEITEKEYARIALHLPIQRGNVEVENIVFLNALLYVVENGCKWRKLPEKYGKWNTIYRRASRRAKNGALETIFIALQRERIIKFRVEHISLDSTSIKVRPDAHGAVKKTGDRVSGKVSEDGTQNFMWLPLMIDCR